VEEKQWTGKSEDLERLFRPRSLAVIGVSADFTRGGGFIWRRVIDQGYTGKKYPVSRDGKEVDGIPGYRSITDIEETVDLVIVAIPAVAVEGVLADCVRKGVKFAVIHAAGFAELGDEGKALQERIVNVSRNGGLRLVGPNCMGICCPDVQLNTIMELDAAEFKPGGIAFCGQSGWATEYFITGGSLRGLTFSTVISSGNQSDLDLYDYISYFGSDPETRVIGAYSESMPRGKEFLDLASEIGATKPIIIWKSGFSQAGKRAAISHSGSIAGDREVWIGAASRSGIIMAEGYEEIEDMAVAFSSPLYPKGRKVGIVVEAGGGGISASDACEKLGLEVRPFSSDLQKQLKEFLSEYLPPFSGISNPLDLVWLPYDKAVTICTKSIELMVGEVDAIISMSYLPFLSAEVRQEYIKKLCELRDRLALPIFMVPPYASRQVDGMKDFTMAGIPTFSSFERAAKAISATLGYQEWVSSL